MNSESSGLNSECNSYWMTDLKSVGVWAAGKDGTNLWRRRQYLLLGERRCNSLLGQDWVTHSGLLLVGKRRLWIDGEELLRYRLSSRVYSSWILSPWGLGGILWPGDAWWRLGTERCRNLPLGKLHRFCLLSRSPSGYGWSLLNGLERWTLELLLNWSLDRDRLLGLEGAHSWCLERLPGRHVLGLEWYWHPGLLNGCYWCVLHLLLRRSHDWRLYLLSGWIVLNSCKAS